MAMIRSSDHDLFDLGIRLFLAEPHEWCQEMIPWTYSSYNNYGDDGIGESEVFYTEHAGTFNGKVWIGKHGTVFAPPGFCDRICYRSTSVVKMRQDWDRFEKIYYDT